MGDAADGDERKEKGVGQIKRAEGRHQDAIERREVARHLGQLRGRPARLGIQHHRLNVAVADERADEEEQHPEGATRGEITAFLGEKDPKRARMDVVPLR